MLDTTHPHSQSGLPISCDIEAQSEYPLGKPITVMGTLHNAGSSDIWVLNWNTFLDPKGQDCLLVTHDGETVPYTGVKTPLGRPDKASYVRIAAGGSASRQIDISGTYAISDRGDYQLSFYLPLLGCSQVGGQEPPQSDNQYTLTIVESEKITIRIVDDSSANVVPKPVDVNRETRPLGEAWAFGDFPEVPLPPTFAKEFSEQEKEDFTKAWLKAYNSIFNAMALVSTNIDATTGYSDYFDRKFSYGRREGWEARRATVLETYKKMLSFMIDAPAVNFTKNDSRCHYNWSAFVDHDAPNNINLCSNAFSGWSLWVDYGGGEVARATIIVHELSHAAGFTEDYGYYFVGYLAENSPDIAVKNAESYACFAMETPAVPASPPYGKIVTLRAENKKYLSIKRDGSLVADQEKVSDSEKFLVADAGRYSFALKEALGDRYVMTDKGTGLLNATATMIGQDQAFYWVPWGFGQALFQSCSNLKYVDFKTNFDGTGLAEPAIPYTNDARVGWGAFRVAEVNTGYRRIKVLNLKNKFLGYLDMKDSAYCEAVLQQDAKIAHRYRWHSGTKPHTGRLDQKTVPDDRSFTYAASSNYPCWGLAENWIWLFWDDKTQTIWDSSNPNGELCASLMVVTFVSELRASSR
jgi:hypothetical protein